MLVKPTQVSSEASDAYTFSNCIFCSAPPHEMSPAFECCSSCEHDAVLKTAKPCSYHAWYSHGCPKCAAINVPSPLPQLAPVAVEIPATEFIVAVPPVEKTAIESISERLVVDFPTIPNGAPRFNGMWNFDRDATEGQTCTYPFYKPYTAGFPTCGGPARRSNSAGGGVCVEHIIRANGTNFFGVKPIPASAKRSQKARSILTLSSTSSDLASTLSVSTAHVWVPSPPCPIEPPFFARPCPRRPRHGFVESRVIKNMDDWKLLLVEVAASDEPDAEIVCMRHIDAAWSGIITQHGLVLGPGNDGATAGKGSVSIPASAPEFYYSLNIDIEDCGILKTPYVEIVCEKGRFLPDLVQVRDGEAVPLTTSYVPTEMTVTDVVTIIPGESLLEWEKRVKDFKPGTVVWHHEGSLASHYSVHCILHKIPVICEPNCPLVGDVLKPTATPEPLKDDDYVEIARSLVHYSTQVRHTENWHETPGARYNAKAYGRMAVATLHAQPLWGREAHLLRLRGAAVGTILMLAGSACAGEARHYVDKGPGMNGHSRPISMIPQGGLRESIYGAALELSLPDLMLLVSYARVDFASPGWVRGGYGGMNWARCCDATLSLGKAVADFLEKPGEGTWTVCLAAMNVLVNTAHNSGKLLNKFISNEEFERLKLSPNMGFINSIVADVALKSIADKPIPGVKFAEAVRSAGHGPPKSLLRLRKAQNTISFKVPYGKRYPVTFKFIGSDREYETAKLEARVIAPAGNRPYGYRCILTAASMQRVMFDAILKGCTVGMCEGTSIESLPLTFNLRLFTQAGDLTWFIGMSAMEVVK